MKNCQSIEKKLTAYLHSELNDSDVQAVKAHLAACAGCRAELERQRVTLSLLGEALEEAPAPKELRAWGFVPSHGPVSFNPRRFELKLFKIRMTSVALASCFALLFIMISACFVVTEAVHMKSCSFCGVEEVAVQRMNIKRPRMKLKKMRLPEYSRLTSYGAPLLPDIDLPAMNGIGKGLGDGMDGSPTMSDEEDVSLFESEGAVGNGIIEEPVPAALEEVALMLLPEPESVLMAKDEFESEGRRSRSLKRMEKAVSAAFNPYVSAGENAFSTFSIDVDTASYGLARTQLTARQLPDPEAVRTEEFINSFDYDYRPPFGTQTFSVHRQMAPSPFRPGLEVLKVGIKGRRIGRDDHRGAVLTLVIDTSGSMNTPERIGLLKQSLLLMIEQLSPEDQVAIVQFGGEARLVQEHIPVRNSAALIDAIQSLQPGGPTQFDQGLELGYRVATSGFRAGDSNRIMILSDGVANLGELDPDAILKQVETFRQKGIYLSVLGFGSGTYDDALLEKLADRGDGMYAYIDTLTEARRLLVDQLASTLHVIASDVKIQIEFNPERVVRYRQLGYENRQLTKEQFRDDSVDAGEVGSGQSVTALYDVELKPDGPVDQPIATVYVRYRRADNGVIEEISSRVTDAVRATSFGAADARFRLAACAAEFAEHLRRSPYSEGTEIRDVLERLQPVMDMLDLDEQVKELGGLMDIVERLEH